MHPASRDQRGYRGARPGTLLQPPTFDAHGPLNSSELFGSAMGRPRASDRAGSPPSWACCQCGQWRGRQRCQSKAARCGGSAGFLRGRGGRLGGFHGGSPVGESFLILLSAVSLDEKQPPSLFGQKVYAGAPAFRSPSRYRSLSTACAKGRFRRSSLAVTPGMRCNRSCNAARAGPAFCRWPWAEARTA